MKAALRGDENISTVTVAVGLKGGRGETDRREVTRVTILPPSSTLIAACLRKRKAALVLTAGTSQGPSKTTAGL